jgi:hypothetical protein
LFLLQLVFYYILYRSLATLTINDVEIKQQGFQLKDILLELLAVTFTKSSH